MKTTTKPRAGQSNNAESGAPLQSWIAGQRGQAGSIGSSEAHAMLLRAAVTPGGDDEDNAGALAQLIHAVDTGLYRVDDELAAAATTQLALLAQDPRQKGWVRLRAALAVGDAATVTETGRHTGALADVCARTRLNCSTVNPDAFGTLNALRRIRLCGRSHPHTRHIQPEELGDILSQLNGVSWWDRKIGVLGQHVNWDAVNVNTALTIITRTAVNGSDAEDRVRLALSMLATHGKPTAALETADVLAGDLCALTYQQLSELANVTSLGSRVVSALTANNTAARLRLAALTSGRGGHKRGTIEAFADDDNSSWVLPSLALIEAGGPAPVALRLARRSAGAAGLAELLGQLAKRDVNRWAEEIAPLADALGEHRWAVALAVYPQLARCYGYGNAHDLVAAIPNSVKDDIVSQRWRTARGPHADAFHASIGTYTGVGDDKLAKAIATLAEDYTAPELRYMPPQGATIGGSAVTSTLTNLTHRYQMGHHQPFENLADMSRHIVAWLKCLSAAELADVAVTLSERGWWSKPIELALSGALAGSSVDDEARGIILDWIGTESHGQLPWDMTLGRYALALSQVIAHQRRTAT